MSNNFSKHRILIVDDSDFARAQISAMLIQHGFSVCGEAGNSEEALRMVKEKKPHLVLIDIVMPEVSGIELAEKITTNFQNLGVIMISSLQHEQVVIEAIAAGAADFVSKPINPIQLKESVEKYLSTVQTD
jgi:two-component system chemotaxis response regulator CheY